MTGAVHAAIGVALGALIKKPKLAFAAGVLSHIVADAIPHKDFSVKTEVALLAASMTAIAARYGVDSPEFWGAIGAISPDFEHGLSALGIIPLEYEFFPTHTNNGRFHARVSDERVSQLIVTILSIIVAETAQRNSEAE